MDPPAAASFANRSPIGSARSGTYLLSVEDHHPDDLDIVPTVLELRLGHAAELV